MGHVPKLSLLSAASAEHSHDCNGQVYPVLLRFFAAADTPVAAEEGHQHIGHQSWSALRPTPN